MRSKAPLTLIEQAIMLVVFGLAAVLCLQAFVWADSASKDISGRDKALIQAQNAAEVLKSCCGDMGKAADIYGGAWDGCIWEVYYDADWKQTPAESAYRLTVMQKEPNLRYLGAAEVSVKRGDVQLAQLNVAWQREVGSDG